MSAFGTWAIDTDDGHEIAAGIRDEQTARRFAQREANKRRESVTLYTVGVALRVVETIAPEPVRRRSRGPQTVRQVQPR